MKNLPLRRFAPQGKPLSWEVNLFKESSGQTLLIILLVMAVALTIGLSVISRSITDVKISQQTEEAARAFSAAEAGIEEALITGTGSGPVIFGETKATYQTAVAGLGEGATEFAFPAEYRTDEIQTLWLANYETYGKVYDRNQLRVLWGNSGTPPNNNTKTPALEVSIYYNDSGNYKVGRFALDPHSGRTPSNAFCNPPSCDKVPSFTTASETAGDKTFQFAATLDLSSFTGSGKTLLFARLRILYGDTSHALGAKVVGGGSGNFPSQGVKIDSTGQAGEATRKVEVSRLHPAPPAIFDFAIYSGGSLIK